MGDMSLWRDFLDEVHATKSENTYKSYRNALRYFPTGSVDEVCDFINGSLKDSTKKQTLQVLKVALRYNDMYDKSYSRLIKGYKPNKTVQECPTGAEVETVWRNITSHKVRAMFALMAYNGLRVGEVAGLDVSDLLKGNRILLRNTKGKRDAIIPLVHPRVINEIKAYLKERKGDSPALFLNRFGNRISTGGIVNLFHREFRDNGMKYHAHSLRRFFANILSRAKIPVQDIQVAMRHASITTTMGYLNIDEDRTKSVLQEVYHAV